MRRDTFRRPTVVTGAAMFAVAILRVIFEFVPQLTHRDDDASWAQKQETHSREKLEAAVHQTRARHAALAEFTAELARIETQADPFVRCADWAGQWYRRVGRASPDSLAVVLWQSDERLGWSGRVIPGELPATARGRRLVHDEHWWVLREVAPLAGTMGGDPVTRECSVPVGRKLFFPVLNHLSPEPLLFLL